METATCVFNEEAGSPDEQNLLDQYFGFRQVDQSVQIRRESRWKRGPVMHDFLPCETRRVWSPASAHKPGLHDGKNLLYGRRHVARLMAWRLGAISRTSANRSENLHGRRALQTARGNVEAILWTSPVSCESPRHIQCGRAIVLLNPTCQRSAIDYNFGQTCK